MSYRQDILKKINEVSRGLIKKSRWYNSNKPFGHIGYRNGQKSYIYEFYCYLKILKDLSKNYSIEYIHGSGLFPKAPADKINKSKFILKDKVSKISLFQVCAGTNVIISYIDNYTIAPDISFQSSIATDSPTETDVILIMDAKYKENPRKNKLSLDDLHCFCDMINDLKIINAPNVLINFSQFQKFSANSLITNGKGLSEKNDFCKKKFIKQVEDFDITKKYNIIG